MAANATISASSDGGLGIRERVTLVAVFNFFQIFGFLSLLCIMATAWLSPRVHRTPSWYIFIGSWMMFCLAYFLLAGQQLGPEPPFTICVLQSSLIYASPPLTAYASLAFLLHLHSVVTSILRDKKAAPPPPKALIFLPIVFFIGFFFEALVVGLSNPEEVARSDSGMFCHLTNGIQVKVSAIAVIIAMVTMLNYEVLTAIVFYRHWGTFRKLPTRSRDAISLPLAIRVSLFSFLPMLGMGLGWTSFFRSSQTSSANANLVVAAIPTACALIFASQEDIFSVWLFWRKPAPLASSAVEPKGVGADVPPV